MPLPAKLLREGVRDMVRICDGRMSGTAYGTVVLHVSRRGGRRAAQQDTDRRLDRARRARRRVDVELPDGELRDRPVPRDGGGRGQPSAWLGTALREQRPGRGDGADLDFLLGSSGNQVNRDSH